MITHTINQRTKAPHKVLNRHHKDDAKGKRHFVFLSNIIIIIIIHTVYNISLLSHPYLPRLFFICAPIVFIAFKPCAITRGGATLNAVRRNPATKPTNQSN